MTTTPPPVEDPDPRQGPDPDNEELSGPREFGAEHDAHDEPDDDTSED